MEDESEQHEGHLEGQLDGGQEQLPVGHALDRLVGLLQVRPRQERQQCRQVVLDEAIGQHHGFEHSEKQAQESGVKRCIWFGNYKK